ncbi:amylo-alpha-1,6-glucosidase [Bacillus coahuilensis p1.1.43]|uniref:Amylo-alpha-1,6-glucosidase n=1 Tax=Bacillus coahuilensis p1.1.43 TaxID=1150625 RepID=A0A147K5J3_9BACI|nr:amylo-alpha-1,6-glucosidase [Bacillus coahuilensis]KUP04930.1 amylo-alpha-1,6-glucosidase [Bacillus coahuilensis p1.1.43]
MDYRVIKDNDLFLLTEPNGNIILDHPYGLGLYTKDTRFLSQLSIDINGKDPVLLSSEADENFYTKILLTNQHDEQDGEIKLWRESVQIERSRFIHDGVLYETFTFTNYYPKPIEFTFNTHFDVDFADMFIVRGFQNGDIGERTGQHVSGQTLSFSYQGADDIKRSTLIEWDCIQQSATEQGTVSFGLQLENAETSTITFKIQPIIGEEQTKVAKPVAVALSEIKKSAETWDRSTARVETDHKGFQRLVTRGLADLKVLLTDLGHGSLPVAGLPWFGVPFGRDSLIAALQLLPFNAEVAKGTLRTMANMQGTKKDAWRDEQPGKIMHEIRFGELANTGQIPFTPYYGTIDATPLFLILLVEYVSWTGDISLVKELQENIDAALIWIDSYGDQDGDLYVEYHQESSKGIANQGWKDSGDSIVHRNGDYAKTPIALSEVQGYVYQAKVGIASIYQYLHEDKKAATLLKEAEELKARYNEDFWMPDEGFYAIALDENKKQVGTITSNPGHTLWSGILPEERVKVVSDMLVSDKMFSGFGIRTMGEGEAAYNPMSYHDGSIWPHDNSMIVIGMSKSGQKEHALKVMEGLVKASQHFEYDRLPELFCGYSDELGKAVKYPVACSPQAWAAGTPLVFVQSLLGLFPNAINKTITLNPSLLSGMNELKVENMQIGKGVLSLHVQAINGQLHVNTLENSTGYTIKQSTH